MSMSMAYALSNSIVRKPSPSLSYPSIIFHPTSVLDNTERMLHFNTIRPCCRYVISQVLSMVGRRCFGVKCSVEPLQSSSFNNPPQPGLSSKKTWITGIVIAILLPFFNNKYEPLSLLKKTVFETAEDMAEVVEKVSNDVKKVAEYVEKELPQGNLKVVVTLVENVAKEAAKDAHLVNHVLHQAEEMENTVETLINSYESIDEATNYSATQGKDNTSK